MNTTATQPFGHGDHPLIGRRVIDHAHGESIGVLRALAPEVKGVQLFPIPSAPLVAWLAPEGGGREWTTDPEAIEAAP